MQVPQTLAVSAYSPSQHTTQPPPCMAWLDSPHLPVPSSNEHLDHGRLAAGSAVRCQFTLWAVVCSPVCISWG